MASPKVGYGLPARPSDGLRRRPEDSRLLSGIPKSTSRTTERETEVPKLVKKESSQPRVASRVPLPSSARRPSPSTTQQSVPKAIPDRHSKSWGSATSSSGYSRSHTQTESGSSSSSRSFDSSTRLGQNVPRRTKPSPSPEAGSLLNGAPNLGSNSSRHQSQGSVDSALGIQFNRGITASPSAIQREEPAEVSKAVGQSPVIYPELDRYRHHDRARSASNRPAVDMPYRLATHDLPPPTPGSLLFSANSSQVSAISGSPSTRFSASPGPGPYSRDTTPTSISSQSPGLIAPSRAFPMNKFRQHSPAFTRPPVTRRRTGSISNEVDSISVDPHGLAAVRESLTSSSSSSTVKGSVINPKKERRGGKSLAAPPPSPPPRKSSQSSQKPFISEDEDELSPRQKRQPGSQPMAVSSPPRSGLPLRNYQSPSPQAMPPRRPSRDGTSDLKSQLFTPIPVIQSSLALRANFERRDSEATIPPPSQTTGLQSNKSASTSNLPTAEQPATSSKLAGRRKLSISGPVRASGTPSPTVKASSGSRFPFFGRKKAASESTANDKDKKEKQKVSRKGPAAGTGHEGYGRLGAIRRRSGIVAAPQVSNESLASGDSFLADRINPVIIAGGAIVENRNASAELIRSESNLSLTTDDRPSIDSIANSTTSSAPRGVSGPGLWPSAIPRERNQMPSARRPSDSSDTGGAPMQSTLAYRRSVQRLKSFPDDPLQLPRPINTSGVITSPLTSFDTSIMSDESSLFNLQQLPSQDLINNNHPAPKKLKKKPRSPRKWNFFSRSNNQPKSDKASEPVAVTVQPVEKKPVAFYTIMDSPEQGVAEPDLKEILREADAYARSPANVDTPEVQAEEAHAVNGSSLQPQSNVLPEPLSPVQDPYPALIEPAFPQMEGIPPPAVTLSSGRPSRLAQVGRIPQVVSNRPARPSPRSFSRPFVANQQLSLHIPQTHGLGLYPRVPNFSKPATPVPDASGGDGSTTDAGTEFSFFSEPRSHITPKDTATQEFLAFSPRKNSDCTTSSTESCVSYNYAEATAIIPKPGDPPVDDEVWDEYDDLLGEETVRERQSTTSSRGVPFHLENYHLKLAKEKALESPTLVTDGRKLSTISDAPTASTTFSADMTERIRKAFQPHPSPTVPSPVPEVPEQKDGGHSRKPSAAESMRRSITSVRKSTQSGSSTSSGEWTPLAQVNLRVGSMTVSKWLSFGQVLFSDIRHLLVKGIESPERPSVLVIDGLGNDDWSFYAAETYSTADFFNLSPRAPLPTDVESSASRYPLSPPNHRQVQYLSQLDEFPFPTHTFNCVVYRFPAAAPESHYQNVLSEARRVLKPGGYLELSILDVDLNNMGNRGRRTIRQLKERIHETSPETNLASTADLIVRLLGKSGFSTIKAARVGVPVASSITSSDDNSQSHGSAENKKKRSSKNQPSLAEMMRDHSPNADEGITNMVSRVGRWWYSRCYENATSHSSGKNSIWNDKALLRECEELGTSLKLMVCCARAPEGINAL